MRFALRFNSTSSFSLLVVASALPVIRAARFCSLLIEAHTTGWNSVPIFVCGLNFFSGGSPLAATSAPSVPSSYYSLSDGHCTCGCATDAIPFGDREKLMLEWLNFIV